VGEFGAFVNTEPQDKLGYYGDGHTFLFRFNPGFRVFNTYNAQGGQNYFFFNSKKMQSSSYPCGIGFGGEDYEGWRIWLDCDLAEKSESNDFDRTYEKGSITDSASKYLKIDMIEVWGFPDDLTDKRQAEFRRQEQDMIMANRKIDKKEFVDNKVTEMILDKQYAFKEHMNIDLDHEKEAQRKGK
jgi:hypothetical protein